MTNTDTLADNLSEISDLVASLTGQPSTYAAIDTDDVEAVLRRLAVVQAVARLATREAVAVMRHRGATWQQVADELRITRQSAHSTYGP